MSNRQRLEGGDQSLNIQAGGGVSVYQGMQYADIRQLFMDLFEQNYEVLLADARQEASRRAGEVVDAFLRELSEQPPAKLDNLREPGVQRALVQAQVEHATTGDPDDVGVFARLLVEKVEHPTKSLTAIALQQAIETVGQLTRAHMDVLAVLFVVLKVRLGGTETLPALRARFRQYLEPYADSFTGEQEVLRHLDATACLAFDTTRAYNVRQILRGSYGAALAESEEQDEFLALAADDDRLLRMFREFDAHEGFLKSCFLSNKGIAIAHAHLSRSVPIGPLQIWVA